MNQNDYETLAKYLGKNCEDVGAYFEKENGKYTGKFKSRSACKIEVFREAFQANVSCSQYDLVANGEGNEEEKIDSVYSSSLQSLLAFYAVNKDNPIRLKINDEKVLCFNEVLFEYKNKVIGYPSSVDVVLVNKKDKKIAFIESKFLEIIRDSSKITKRSPDGEKVVGISYFNASDSNGYKQALGLSLDDLSEIGISRPSDEAFGDKKPKVLEDGYFDGVKGFGKFQGSIRPINDNQYVYADGIKQILSHIIGIQNFKKGEREYGTNDPLPLIKDEGYEVFYVELYNEFPEFNKLAQQRVKDFKKHAEKSQRRAS